jgi:hypothetical protein
MPDDPRHAADFPAAMQAAMASPEKEVVVTAPDGRPMRIVKNPEPGVMARIEAAAGDDGTAVTVVWAPAATRPAAYPATVPFIPMASASVTMIAAGGRSSTQVQWLGVPDHEAMAERLVDESLADGWTRTPVQPSTPEPTRMITLERGNEGRMITLRAMKGIGIIMLADTGSRVDGS